MDDKCKKCLKKLLKLLSYMINEIDAIECRVGLVDPDSTDRITKLRETLEAIEEEVEAC